MNPKITITIDAKNKAVASVEGMLTVGAKVDLAVTGLPSGIPDWESTDAFSGASLRFRLVDEMGHDLARFPRVSTDAWTKTAATGTTPETYSATNVELDTAPLRMRFDCVPFNERIELGMIFDSVVDDAQYAIGKVKVSQWAMASTEDPKVLPDWRETLVKLKTDLASVEASKTAAEAAATAAGGSSSSASASASAAAASAASASASANAAEVATTRRPRIGLDGNWEVWDAETSSYRDTGVRATGDRGSDSALKYAYDSDGKAYKIAIKTNALSEKVLAVTQESEEGVADPYLNPIATGTTSPRHISDRFADVINVKDFGAKGDGVTDDTEAIKAALAHCKTNGATCVGNGTFKITSQVNISCNADFSSAEFRSYMNSTPLTVGGTRDDPFVRSVGVWLPDVRNYSSNCDFAGVEFLGCRECDINTDMIYGFDTALMISGGDKQFTYNSIAVGVLWAKKTALKILPTSSSWVNQNTFIGGEFVVEQTREQASSDTIQVNVGADENTTHFPNNNTFVGCSFETDKASYSIVLCGSYNSFVNCRFEQDNAKNILVDATLCNVYGNVILGGYNAESLNAVINENNGHSASNNIVYSGFGVVPLDPRWSFKVTPNGLECKTGGATYKPKVIVGKNGLFIGDGSADPRKAMTGAVSYVYWGDESDSGVFDLIPRKTKLHSLGRTGFRWKDVWTENGSVEARLAALEAKTANL